MLSAEAREQLSARLTEASEQPPEPETSERIAKEDGDTISTAPEGTIASDQPEPDKQPPAADAPDKVAAPQPKMVPLEEHIRLRQERKAIREENQQLKEKLAQLDGYLTAKAQERKGDWLDELLGETKEQPPAPDPRDLQIQELKGVVSEIQMERGQKLLRETIESCRTKDPTVDPEFLIEEFKVGRTPDQALAKWDSYKSKFTAGSQTTQTSNATPIKAPPTVARAPAGKQSVQPKTWADTQIAVRQALRGK